jgi:phosphinothricin acetyltransferase
MGMHVEIREMTMADWDSVSSIYLDGIATGQATFETSVPSWEKWNASHLACARLVIVSAKDGLVRGWAALSPVSTRPVYNGVAEVSVYVASEARRLGIGRALLERLIKESEQNGIWTVQAGIFPENQASIALHQKLGFRVVGTRERIGKLNGLWRDTVLLERRSTVVGC